MTPTSQSKDLTDSGPGQPGPRERVQVGTPTGGCWPSCRTCWAFTRAAAWSCSASAAERSQVTLAFRYDLPDPPDPELAADIAAHACAVLTRESVPAAIVVGYGPAELVGPAAEPLAGALLHAAWRSVRCCALRAAGTWSPCCQDQDLLPGRGHLLRPVLASGLGHAHPGGPRRVPRTGRRWPGRWRRRRARLARRGRRPRGPLRRIDKLITGARTGWPRSGPGAGRGWPGRQ